MLIWSQEFMPLGQYRKPSVKSNNNNNSWGDGYIERALAMQAWGPELEISTLMKKKNINPCFPICAHNLISRKQKYGHLELSWLNWSSFKWKTKRYTAKEKDTSLLPWPPMCVHGNLLPQHTTMCWYHIQGILQWRRKDRLSMFSLGHDQKQKQRLI